MSNYSILEQNTLAGFSETAGCFYLKLIDVFKGDESKAFFVANQYERKVGNVFDYILAYNPVWKADASTKTQLSAFFAERWRHNFMQTPTLSDNVGAVEL